MRVNYNGNFIEFPDNMSDDEINNALSELPSDFFVDQQDTPKIADEELRGAVSGIFDYSDNNAADVVHHGAVDDAIKEQPIEAKGEGNFATNLKNEVIGGAASAVQGTTGLLNMVSQADNYAKNKARELLGMDTVAAGQGIGDDLSGVSKVLTGYDTKGDMEAIRNDANKAKTESYKAGEKDIDSREGLDIVSGYAEHPDVFLGKIASSLPEMVVGMGLTGAVAKGIAIKAAEEFGGLTTAAGKEAAQSAVQAAAGRLIGVGGITEGAQSAGHIAYDAQQDGKRFEDYAPQAVTVGAGTALIDVASGKMFGDAATDLIAGTNTVKKDGILKTALKQGGTEAAEESPQSGLEAAAKNSIYSDDPQKQTSVVDEMIHGGVIGFGMGAGMGGSHAAINKLKSNSDTTQPTADISPETLNAGNEALDTANTTSDGTSPLGETIKANESPAASDNLGDLNSILKGVLDDANHQKEVTQTIGDEITSAENIDDAITKSNAVIDLTLQDATIHNAGTKADEDKAQLESEIDKDKQQSILNQQSITDDAIKSASEESKAIADADKVDALIDAGASLIGKFFVLPNGKKVVATKDQLKQFEKSRSEIAPTELQTGTDETQERRSQNQINDVLTNDTEFNQTESATNNARVTPLSQAVDSTLASSTAASPNQESVLSEFTPTHELPSGEKVALKQDDEGNNYFVEDGSEWNYDSNAEPIAALPHQSEASTDQNAPQMPDSVPVSETAKQSEQNQTPFASYDDAVKAFVETLPENRRKVQLAVLSANNETSNKARAYFADQSNPIGVANINKDFAVFLGKATPVENVQSGTQSSSSAMEVAPQKENAPEISTESVVKDLNGHSDSLQGDSVSNNDDEAYDSILTENKLPNGYSATILSSQSSKYGRGRFATTAEITRPDGSKYKESIDHYDQIPTGVYIGNKNYEHDDNGFIKRGSNKPVTHGDVSNTQVDANANDRADLYSEPVAEPTQSLPKQESSNGISVSRTNPYSETERDLKVNAIGSVLPAQGLGEDKRSLMLADKLSNVFKGVYNANIGKHGLDKIVSINPTSDQAVVIDHDGKAKLFAATSNGDRWAYVADVKVKNKTIGIQNNEVGNSTPAAQTPSESEGYSRGKGFESTTKRITHRTKHALFFTIDGKEFVSGKFGVMLGVSKFDSVKGEHSFNHFAFDDYPREFKDSTKEWIKSVGAKTSYDGKDTVYDYSSIAVDDSKRASVIEDKAPVKTESQSKPTTQEKKVDDAEMARRVAEYDTRKEKEAADAIRVAENRKYTLGNAELMKQKLMIQFNIKNDNTELLAKLLDAETAHDKYMVLSDAGLKSDLQFNKKVDLNGALRKGLEFGYFDLSPRKGYSVATAIIDLAGAKPVEKSTENKQVYDNVSKNDAEIDNYLLQLLKVADADGIKKLNTSDIDALIYNKLATAHRTDDFGKQTRDLSEFELTQKGREALREFKAKEAKDFEKNYRKERRITNDDARAIETLIYRYQPDSSKSKRVNDFNKIRQLLIDESVKENPRSDDDVVAEFYGVGEKQAPAKSDAMTEIDAELDDLLGEAGAIILNRFSMKAVPEANIELTPVMAKIMRVLAKKGYLTFKESARQVLTLMRHKFGDKIADAITIDDLQSGYIGMAQHFEGTTHKRDVVMFESIDELYQGEATNDEQVKENSTEKTDTSFPANETTGNTVEPPAAKPIEKLNLPLAIAKEINSIPAPENWTTNLAQAQEYAMDLGVTVGMSIESAIAIKKNNNIESVKKIINEITDAANESLSNEKPSPYHPAIAAYADQLVENGGVEILPDNSRTKSVNPDWFKSGKKKGDGKTFQAYKTIDKDGKVTEFYSGHVSVKEIKNAVDAHEAGKELTNRQHGILLALSDVAQAEEDFHNNRGDFADVEIGSAVESFTDWTHGEVSTFQDMSNSDFNGLLKDAAKLAEPLVGVDKIRHDMDALGFSEQEIQEEIKRYETRNSKAVTSNATEEKSSDAKNATGTGIENTAEAQILSQYTNDEILAREEAAKVRAEQEAIKAKEAAKKEASARSVDTLVDEMLGKGGTTTKSLFDIVEQPKRKSAFDDSTSVTDEGREELKANEIQTDDGKFVIQSSYISDGVIHANIGIPFNGVKQYVKVEMLTRGDIKNLEFDRHNKPSLDDALESMLKKYLVPQIRDKIIELEEPTETIIRESIEPTKKGNKNVPSTSDSIDKLSKRSIQYLKDAVRDKIVSADDAIAALNLKMKEIEDEPANRTPESERSVFLFKPQARKKLDEITWAVDQILKRKQKDSNVPSTNTDLERDSTVTNSANSRNETPVFDGSTGDADLLGQSSEPVKSTENVANSDSGDSISIALTGGEQGDNQLLDGNETDVIASSDARDSDSGRSGQDSINGMDVKRDGSNPIKELPAKSVKGLKAKQVKHQTADLENVKEAMPFLNEGQADDVVFAEKRFEEHNGVMFTNGTGTGKTFSGLGIVSRFANQGKNNILIVAPSQNILDSWLKTAKNFFDLNVTLLADTKDAGEGIVATTYANFGDNVNLVNRDWDLIVTDEAHYLMSNAAGSETSSLLKLRALTNHQNGFYTYFNNKFADLVNEYKEAKAAAGKGEISEELRTRYAETHREESEKWANAESKTKVTMLSATPFAYESNIDYANGYLFDYPAGDRNGAYNSGSGKDQFFMQHLGYRMRYNKLTKPDAKVDRSTMQRQFNENLKKTGAVSSRTLDVPFDYDRQFILTESAIGQRIDEALQWLSDTRSDELARYINKKFDGLTRKYVLEAIKAKEIIPVIKEHLATGRKVLVFHDYKKGGSKNPFIFTGDTTRNQEVVPLSDGKSTFKRDALNDPYNRLLDEYDRFKAQFPDLISNELLNKMDSPIERFEQEFGKDALIYNGDVSSKERIARVAQFNDDNSGKNLILLQSASAKEGVSFHDTTGVHQRVLINIGLPTAPTTAIQQEGRIYRVGQQSDAIFRYVNTGTNWERWAFASTIAGRASEAENLALGEGARGLRDAFINAFENSDSYPVGHEGEGKGGKDSDKQAYRSQSEMDRAKGFYYATQKKNSRTKSAEGTDYYATPEPVGLVMTRLADARTGEKMLEPSAGHGAIARWFRTDAERTAIEPSSELNSRLALVFQDGDIKRQTFEDLNIVNKFDAIVMNPPFGTGGKTAIEHLEKAFNHLRDGGRVVALIPEGTMADKRLDAWLSAENANVKPLVSSDDAFAMGKGDIYEGDTIVYNDWVGKGRSAKYGEKKFKVASVIYDHNGNLLKLTDESGESVVYFSDNFKVKPTGERPNTSNKQLVADISLPKVTFERAYTGQKTHIVVIEKTTESISTSKSDFSNVNDINTLFDMMDMVEIDERVKPVEEVAETPASKTETTSPAVESFTPDEKENFDHYAKISADSLASLRKVDLDRVLEQAQDSERSKFARYIASVRPDLFEEIHDIMKEDYGKENWHIAPATKTVGTLVEGKHTKTGEAIFTVKLPERVERDTYTKWAAAAKQMGGSWSRFTGGFLFKTKDAANKFMDYLSGSDNSEIKFSRTASKLTLQDVKSEIKDMGINLFISEKDGVIELTKIVVPEELRDNKLGSKAMSIITDYADATGQTISLTPSSDFGGNKNRLIEFYKRFGFIDNKGRNKDFRFTDTMYREPKGNVKYSYAGAKAQNADQSALALAVEMDQQGVDNETIRKETGWFLGMDDKWRFEISDDKSSIDASKFKESKENNGVYKAVLSDIFSHNTLYKEYPFLKDITVATNYISGYGASWSNAVNHISLNNGYVSIIKGENSNIDELKESLIHEIQHAIQDYEGFSKGGTQENFAYKLDETKKLRDEFSKLSDAKFDLSEAGKRNSDGYENIVDRQQEIMKQIRAIGTPFDSYNRLAGEIEARDTQSRMNLTDAQRKQQTPYVSQGISKEDAIVRFGDGVANSEAVETHTEKSFMSTARSALDAKFGKGWFDRLWGTGSFEAISNNEALRMVGELKGNPLFSKWFDDTLESEKANNDYYRRNGNPSKTGTSWFKNVLDGKVIKLRDSTKNDIAKFFLEATKDSDSFLFGKSHSKDLYKVKTEVNNTDWSIGQEITNDGKDITLTIQGVEGEFVIGNYRSERPYIDAIIAPSMKGKDFGSLLYQIAYTWAHNNGKVITNPDGLTTINILRRTYQTLSSALRYGSTSHVQPSRDQIDSGMNWELGNDGANIEHLASLIEKRVFESAHKLNNLNYNLSDGNFYNQDGEIVNDDEIKRLARSSTTAREYGVGLATAKAALVTRSLREAQAQDGRMVENSVANDARRWVLNQKESNPVFKSSTSGKIEAFYIPYKKGDPKSDKVYFVPENISKDRDVAQLALHEIGVHMMRLGQNQEEFDAILSDVASKRESNPLVKSAFESAERAGTKDEHLNEEALAHLVDKHPELKLSQRFIAWFKQAVRDFAKYVKWIKGADKLAFIQWANKLNEKDWVYLANSALRSAPEKMVFKGDPNGGGVKFSGDNKPLLAPNGKPSNLNAMQHAQVRTPEFKAWFGEWINDPENASKVVDENGEPLVIYHGTNADFTEFEDNSFEQYQNSFWFASDKEMSYSYGDNVISAFLNIKNPRTKGNTDILFSDNEDGYISYKKKYVNGKYENINPLKIETAVAIRKNQIKSATGNTGAFSKDNNDIRYSKSLTPSNGGKGNDNTISTDVDYNAYENRFKAAKPVKNAEEPREIQHDFIMKFLNKFEPVRSVTDRLNRFVAYFDPMGTLPNSDDYLGDRGLTLGKYDVADDLTKRIFNVLSKASEDDAIATYEYLTQKDASPLSIKDATQREAATHLKETIIYLGEKLVEKGVIPRASYEENKGAYLPRVYLKHILGEEGDAIMSALGTGRTISDQGYAKKRLNDFQLPPEVRRLILGEIKNAAYLASRTVNITMRDVAMMNFFESIATNKDWVWDQSLVTLELDLNTDEPTAIADAEGNIEYQKPDSKGKKVKTRKVTPFFLKKEAERMRRQAQVSQPKDRDDVNALAEMFEKIAENHFELMNMKGLPKDFIKMPDSARYGALRGLVVRKEIYNDIVGTVNSFGGGSEISTAEKWLGEGGYLQMLNSHIKFARAGINIPTQIINIISNPILIHIRGVRFDRVPKRLFQAIKEIRDEGEVYKIAKEYGLRKGTFYNQEMRHITNWLIELEAEKGTSWTTVGEAATYLMRKVGVGYANLNETVGNLHQFVEMVGKLASMIDDIENGITPRNAYLKAQDAVFDYSNVSNSVRWLRNNAIGIPFLTFFVKSTEATAKALINRPSTVLTYYVALQALSLIVAAMNDVDDDDLDALELLLKDYVREKGHAYFLPWRDEKGRWQAMDFGKILPWTPAYEIAHALKNLGFRKGTWDAEFNPGALLEAIEKTGLGGAPVFEIVEAFHKTTRKKDDGSTGGEKLAKFFTWAWNLSMPPMLAMKDSSAVGVAFDKVMSKDHNGALDKNGDPKFTDAQAINKWLGLNFYSVDPEAQIPEEKIKLLHKQQRIERDRRTDLREPDLSYDDKKSINEDYDERARRAKAIRDEFDKKMNVLSDSDKQRRK